MPHSPRTERDLREIAAGSDAEDLLADELVASVDAPPRPTPGSVARPPNLSQKQGINESYNILGTDELETMLERKLDTLRYTLMNDLSKTINECLSGIQLQRIGQATGAGNQQAEVVKDWDYKPEAPFVPQASPDDEDEITELFNMIDLDGNGELQKSELIRAFKVDKKIVAFCEKHPRLAPLTNPLTFKEAFDEIDSDHSNSVSLQELREHVLKMAAKNGLGDLPGAVNGDDEDGEEDGDGDGKNGYKRGTVVFGADIKTSKLDEEIYDVANFYKKSGCWQAIARSDYFINLTLGVISVNAVYLGVDADHNDAKNLLEASIGFIIMEYAFCVFFLCEWIIRFAAFEAKSNCLKDGWFKFDSLLVLLMVCETWVLPFVLPLISAGSAPPPTAPLRLLRLLRLSRLVRLIRQLPELVVIIKGMMYSIRAVASSLLMASILIYVFAIVLNMLLKEEDSVTVYFETLPMSMWTLLMDGLFLCNTATVLGLLAHSGEIHTTISVITFLFFILIAGYTVMNMLIGIILEVVSAVSENQKEESDIKVMKQTILLELKKHDDGDGMIDEDEMTDLMADPGTVDVLETLGIDVPFLQDLQVMSYSTPDITFAIETLIEQMLVCRSGLSLSVKHMVIQTKLITWTLTNGLSGLEDRMKSNMKNMLDAREARTFKLLQDILAATQQPRRDPAPEKELVVKQKHPSRPSSVIKKQHSPTRPLSGTRPVSAVSLRGKLVRSASPNRHAHSSFKDRDNEIPVSVVKGKMVKAPPAYVIELDDDV